MSQIIKPVMLDETGQATNQKLNELGSKIDSHKTSTAQALSNVGSKVEGSGQATSQSLNGVSGVLQTIAEAIESVHSVNGMTGDVVIDSTNISIDKLNNTKTIKQVLDAEQDDVDTAVGTMQSNVNDAIDRLNQASVPVSFETTGIEGDDYLLTISLETP